MISNVTSTTRNLNVYQNDTNTNNSLGKAITKQKSLATVRSFLRSSDAVSEIMMTAATKVQ